MNYFQVEKMQNLKIGGLKRSLTALGKKLLRRGVVPRENYGIRELRMFDDKMQSTFTKYNINSYTNAKAKELINQYDNLVNNVEEFCFPQ